MRLDLKLKELYPEKTRNQLINLIKDYCVKVNGELVKKSAFEILDNDKIEIDFKEPKIRKDIIPQNIPLNIIFENNDYLVINKQTGISVHPSEESNIYEGTIVNAVMYHCGNSLSGINGELRPGIIHRLDKDTTGVLIIAKNDRFHAHLAKQIEERKVKKIYRAIVCGHPKDGIIEAPIGRSLKDRKKMTVRSGQKYAKTSFKVLKYDYDLDISFVEIELFTGRTHQIRVHFSSIGYPVVGDQLYGFKKVNDIFEKKFGVKTYLLHSYKYEFEDLDGNRKEFIADSY